MKRDIYHKLQEWKESRRRKPLILDGARQVGKAHALKYFAKNSYKNYVYLNFDDTPGLASYFEQSLNPQEIIKTLTLHFETAIQAENTLLIFDEVQECSRALSSLKFFCELANEYHIIAAGSLLGIKTKEHHGFPVGKI